METNRSSVNIQRLLVIIVIEYVINYAAWKGYWDIQTENNNIKEERHTEVASIS